MRILSICGSPRKGNSETILLKLQEILKGKNIDNEIILLREKKVSRCLGCVEYCNKELQCRIQDDMQLIMNSMERAEGFIFISPNYFKMPTGLFKDFIDRCSIFYTAGKEDEFEHKKAIVIAVGTDSVEHIDICMNNIAYNFAETIGLKVVAKKSFRSHSELNGNYQDIIESGINPEIEAELEELASALSL